MKLDLPRAAKNLGLEWPDDDRIIDYGNERLGVSVSNLDDLAAALDRYVSGVDNVEGVLGVEPPWFLALPEMTRCVYLACDWRGAVTLDELASHLDELDLRIHRQIAALRNRAGWCDWGHHPIEEAATIAFVANFDTWDDKGSSIRNGWKADGVRNVACVDCYEHGIAVHIAEFRQKLAAGYYHESWNGARDERLRSFWAAPALLYDGLVRRGNSRLQNRDEVRTVCGGCGRQVVHARRTNRMRRQWTDRQSLAEALRVMAEQPDENWVLTAEAFMVEEFVCSERCRGRLRSRERAQEPDARPCEVCTEPFVPARRDARFCCNACRQAAYRQRRR